VLGRILYRAQSKHVALSNSSIRWVAGGPSMVCLIITADCIEVDLSPNGGLYDW
jgi:hypothetical protein